MPTACLDRTNTSVWPALTNRFDSGRSGPYSGGPCHAQREGSGSRTLADTKAIARAQRDSSSDSNGVTSAAVHRALFAPSQANECPLRRVRPLLLISGLGVRFPRDAPSQRQFHPSTVAIERGLTATGGPSDCQSSTVRPGPFIASAASRKGLGITRAWAQHERRAPSRFRAGHSFLLSKVSSEGRGVGSLRRPSGGGVRSRPSVSGSWSYANVGEASLPPLVRSAFPV